MTLRTCLIGGLLIGGLCFTEAVAQPTKISQMTLGYTYFNRPGADMEAHDKAVVECALEASTTRSLDDQMPMVAIVDAMISNAFAEAVNKATAASGLENCMVVAGWRVVKLSDAQGKALARLDRSALSAQLSQWVGQATPEGEVVRVWDNEASNAANDRYEVRPAQTKGGQLSLKAARHDVNIAAPPRAPRLKTVKLDPKWPTKPVKPEQAGAFPEGGFLLLIETKGVSQRNGIGLFLSRMGKDKGAFPSIIDGGPDLVSATVGTLRAKKEGNFFAFFLPEGRWRIEGMGILPHLSFCLGSPAFEAKAGEVVFAGSFDLGGADLSPDLDLTPAKIWLGSAVTEELRPAEWTNGSTAACGSNAIYALEFTGAPFEPEYDRGSAATIQR